MQLDQPDGHRDYNTVARDEEDHVQQRAFYGGCVWNSQPEFLRSNACDLM